MGSVHPKNGKARIVPLASKVYAEILKLQASNIWKGDDAFLFQSDKPNRPMYSENLRNELYKQLGKIGIDAVEKERRQLYFHSLRHFFNSLLVNSNISKFKVQSLIGHQSDAMTENYYHPDEMSDVKLLQDKLFE
jgi:integrase